MWSLFFEVLPLAIGAMVTPTLFALQVLVVSGPSWRPHARAVVVGAGTVFVVYFALILGGMSQLPDANTGRTTRTEYIIEAIAGAVVLAVSLWLLRPHKALNQKMKEKVQARDGGTSPWVYAGLAAYMAVTDFSTLALLLPALHDVTRSDADIVFKAIVVAFVFVLVLVPVLLPPAMVKFGGQKAVSTLHRVYNWIMDHQMQVMGGVTAFIGVVLLWRGLGGLL